MTTSGVPRMSVLWPSLIHKRPAVLFSNYLLIKKLLTSVYLLIDVLYDILRITIVILFTNKFDYIYFHNANISRIEIISLG